MSSLIGNNLWERDQLRKLTTADQVRTQIERCELGMKSAPSYSKTKEWGRKLTFLDRLLRDLEKRP